jgi:hypothetical protein
VRYCRCGARLARDNPQGRCGPCGQKAREVALGAPQVPAEFWETEQMRAALDSRHMGRVCYAYRHHRFHDPGPLSQELVAGWFGITQAQLSRIENGPLMCDFDKLIYWARTLRFRRGVCGSICQTSDVALLEQRPRLTWCLMGRCS